MKSREPVVPARVARVFARLPRLPGSVLFVSALNLVVARKLPDDLRHALNGKIVSLCFTDARISIDFAFRRGHFSPRVGRGEADLRISASTYDYYRLARGLVDADTLFFSRRLVLEGDTELGVSVKYALDAIDLPSLLGKLPRPSKLFSRFVPSRPGA